MKLTRSEFSKRYEGGTLKIAFIGMSNIGKSYTAIRLATHYKFNLIEVDKIIWENLGHDSMEAFAKWQGHPYTDGYAERESHSIALESEATRKAINIQEKNPILDTTGSVIYTSEDVLKELSDNFYIVYIKAMEDHIERLKIQYFNHPKPLVWAGHYQKKDALTEKESIMTCYPKLLAARAKAYAALADVTLTSSTILNPKTTIEDIYEELKPAT